ncbi:MAG: hypothetical protein A3F33_03605 [Candidatus Woykebacteria bacterium RIFCSPHIGHO2_12_FULL_43_10]|uniref:dolichyl-phosphate beta-glucosyltransferase n=2 Tax=Candidatus Woykeibacteriota TaxID=1817899 RepID=A0A1G1WW09_9BACT|nr:MAG: hypothetical protein A3J50_03315 [Candidatus Woykebacteria bacterium RIFCSPHIGHO2_02_FULL_43_16b]OGY30220.1 MAG: hypothetical protein A3F33_03605 [Candidatus Woykebacteria bacterium RIFCSPHIGHO2_12_FULL_43_10]OGY31761.1 MAG: hypothetical protein A3A61_02045 [Candidatus Woykebacteria bacterium RIFCSPLOWO2_01_FULL_43_14]
MLISFVVPMYNEEKRIDKTVSALNDYLSRRDFDHEVIFVDDGSKDQTLKTLSNLKPKFSHKVVTYANNKGKGFAVKTGALSARGDYILLLDADMSTPIEEFDKFYPHLNQNTVLIGTRKGLGAQVKKPQPFIRQKMGEVFTLLSSTLIVPGITDFTCGFKCFPKSAQKVFERSVINRWSYDPEILFLAHKSGLTIHEIPITWTNDTGSKVNLLKDAFVSLVELVKIRVNDFQGLYS